MSRPNHYQIPKLEVWKGTAFGTYNLQATGLEIRIQLLAVWIIPLRGPKKTLELESPLAGCMFRRWSSSLLSCRFQYNCVTSLVNFNAGHQRKSPTYIGCWEAEFLTSALVPWCSLVCREGTALGRVKLRKSILEIEGR